MTTPGPTPAARRRHARGSERWPVERAAAQPRPGGAAVAGHRSHRHRHRRAGRRRSEAHRRVSTGSCSPAAGRRRRCSRSLPSQPAGLQVAAVGQATAQVLRQRGWRVDLVPDRSRMPARWSRRFAPRRDAGHAGAVSRELARVADDRERPRATRRRGHAGRGLSHRARRARRGRLPRMDRARRHRRRHVREPVGGRSSWNARSARTISTDCSRAPPPWPSARPRRGCSPSAAAAGPGGVRDACAGSPTTTLRACCKRRH